MTDLVSLTARGFNTEITNVKIRKCCFWIFYKSESDHAATSALILLIGLNRMKLRKNLLT